MIDDFAIGLTHFLMALAIWRLLSRTDIDVEPVALPDASPEDSARPGALAGAQPGTAAGRRRMRMNRA